MLQPAPTLHVRQSSAYLEPTHTWILAKRSELRLPQMEVVAKQLVPLSSRSSECHYVKH